MKKAAHIAIASLMLVAAIAGCVQQQEDSVVVDGVQYFFSHPLNEVKDVPVYYPQPVREKMIQSTKINIVFDCSVPEERPSFAVAAFNAVTVVQNYYIYSLNRAGTFNTFCFAGSQWFNATDTPIDAPTQADATLWFKGPLTGAQETSVLFAPNNTIVIQGTSHDNLTLATDAFSLSFLGRKR